MQDNNSLWTCVILCKVLKFHARFCNQFLTMQYTNMQILNLTNRLPREVRNSKFIRSSCFHMSGSPSWITGRDSHSLTCKSLIHTPFHTEIGTSDPQSGSCIITCIYPAQITSLPPNFPREKVIARRIPPPLNLPVPPFVLKSPLNP